MASMALLARSPALWVVVFLSGGIATATYTLGLAILGQRFDAGTLVSANAAFIACYGVGTILGPPAVGALMDRLGPNALPTALGCVSACIFLCASAARLEWQRPVSAICAVAQQKAESSKLSLPPRGDRWG
jgi:MFS family permease